MDISLSQIRGIGPARLKALTAVGVHTVRELIMLLPRDYRDMSAPVPLAQVQPGESYAMKVRICGDVRQSRFHGLTTTRVMVTDDTETLPAVWHNQPWLSKQLSAGQELLLYGRVEMRRGRRQISSPTIEHEEGILPVYGQIAGIPPAALRGMMEHALKESEGQWPDELPTEIREKYGLCEWNFAMRCAHFPPSRPALEAARHRLAFEELLLYQIALRAFRGTRKTGVKMDFSPDLADEYWKMLSFPPTNAQKRVLSEIVSDLLSETAMARMVQGDVGCGKTAVAFGAMYLAWKSGVQAALMAPTEVLAGQHFEAAKALFEPLGVRVGLLTGSLTPKNRMQARKAAAAGEWDMIIGTHALFSEGVEYRNLGLVITDEQHRFGVRQRTMLGRKGDSPNVLVMSATPIPRTLALILYGDLDISVVDELPPGRKPVKTRIVPDEKREGMYEFICAQVRAGRQAYVICPLVEESEAIDARSAQTVYEELSKGPLKNVRVMLAHGQMKSDERDEALDAFRRGEADVLVSTTVVEVGVNVPNATVMVIENADRFGLAQLHQLRGRVGRGAEESWCFLMADSNERLKTMCSTNDGFVIAQKDMELRGPGEILGTRQTGAVAPGLGAIMGNTALLKETHDEARLRMSQPDSQTTVRLMELAKTRYQEKLKDTGVN